MWALAEDRPNVTISLMIEEASTVAEYRTSDPEVDLETLAVVDELAKAGWVALHQTWAAGAGAGAGKPDRGNGYP